ncbi:hypothetical protein K456DRAFT_1938879 [Colletotrichum gloeosporioides 23]|nr:hypothetical protein K456DRAFT_1938879 [Colletotrichum gloeosporioides 23]
MMVYSPMDQQSLVPVCRGTSLLSGRADSFVASPQSYPSASQALPFSDQHSTTYQRDFLPYYEAPVHISPSPNLNCVDSNPSQTGEGILNPALVKKLQLDVGEQFIIEHRLQGEDWDTIAYGFQQRFGVSRSSSKSALAMRLSRLKAKHPEIRLLFEGASSKARRRKGQGHHQKTGPQGRNTPAEETITARREDCSELQGMNKPAEETITAEREDWSQQVRPEISWSRPGKTIDGGTKHRSTQGKAAAAADVLLTFLGQPDLRDSIAPKDYSALIRVRSRLRE